jgi:hypothetical protein
MFLDAALSGYGVTFNHQKEIDRNGGKQSCAICHHMNLPRAKNSGCYECHSDLYLTGDSFLHDWHASPSGAKLACTECHAKGQTRSSANVKPCADCHKHLIPTEATIKIKTYVAPSYVDAMHKLCIGCHAQVAMKENRPEIARCTECHGAKSKLPDDEALLSHRRVVAGPGGAAACDLEPSNGWIQITFDPSACSPLTTNLSICQYHCHERDAGDGVTWAV